MVTMVEVNRMSLRMPKEQVAELKKKALTEGKSLAEFIIDASNYFDFQLTDAISLRVDYSQPVATNSEVIRIDVFFKESSTSRLLRGLWYELWVLQDAVEDALHTTSAPTNKEYAEFAFRFIAKRYKDNNNVLPKEYGAFIWKDRTEKLVQNREELWIWYDEAVAQV